MFYGIWQAGLYSTESLPLYNDSSNKKSPCRWRSLDAVLEPNEKDLERGVQIEYVARTFRKMFSGPIIVNTGFDKAKANAALASRDADLVAFGVPYIANPDLVERLRVGGPLSKPDPSTFYSEGPKGYTDYPAQPLVSAAA
jgi:N-ethylmaleimide reductase